jgi:hypothetical protein
MQVFTPYANPIKNANCLDPKRRNKQILELLQILSVNLNIDIGWKIPKSVKNHPNVKKWVDYQEYLIEYLLELFKVYSDKTGKIHKSYYNFNTLLSKHRSYYSTGYLPKWFSKETCYGHQSLLLNKNKEYYSEVF